MPAPTRPLPYRVEPNALSVPKGLVGVYTDAEIDALLAALPAGGDSAITVHAGSPPVPLSSDPTPQELEDSFAVLSNGLHYYPDNGSLVAVLRGEYQTTITITGAVKSVAQIVKSSAGLPTPENPSMIVTQAADGKWFRVRGDRLDRPFGDPEIVDIFKLVGGGDLTVLNAYYTALEVDALLAALPTGGDCDLSNYYVKEDVNVLLADKADKEDAYTKQEIDSNLTSITEQISAIGDLNLLNSQIQSLAAITQGVMDKVDTKADSTTVSTLATTLMDSIMEVRTDTYTKKEVDDKIEAEKDFSIANDNVLLASITSLQEIVSNLGTDIGTGQVDVLDAIRGVEIEPSMITLSGDTASPIAWKGNLSLTPVKEGDNWRLHWNDGKAIHTLLHGSEFTPANIVLALDGQDVSVANLVTGGFELNQLAMGAAGDRLITQVAGGPENTVAYLSDIVPPTPVDLSPYAKAQNNAQNLLTKTITAVGYGFGNTASPTTALSYTDTGEGYGDRLVLNMGLTNEYLVYKSDLDSVFPVIDASQFATTVTAASLDTRIKSLESKSAATSNINDASNAALKKSILDAVALMIAGGGRQPPADIDWTACRNFGSSTNHPTAQARMIGGVIELRGTLSYPSGATGDQSFCRLPVGFPFAEFTTSVPAAARVTTGSVAVAAFVTFSSQSANIGYDTASRANEVFLTGIKVKAAY